MVLSSDHCDFEVEKPGCLAKVLVVIFVVVEIGEIADVVERGIDIVLIDVTVAVFVFQQLVVFEDCVEALVFVAVAVFNVFLAEGEFDEGVSGVAADVLSFLNEMRELLGGFPIVHESVDATGQPSERIAHGVIS
jgi:hypothetical protein